MVKACSSPRTAHARWRRKSKWEENPSLKGVPVRFRPRAPIRKPSRINGAAFFFWDLAGQIGLHGRSHSCGAGSHCGPTAFDRIKRCRIERNRTDDRCRPDDGNRSDFGNAPGKPARNAGVRNETRLRLHPIVPSQGVVGIDRVFPRRLRRIRIFPGFSCRGRRLLRMLLWGRFALRLMLRIRCMGHGNLHWDTGETAGLMAARKRYATCWRRRHMDRSVSDVVG